MNAAPLFAIAVSTSMLGCPQHAGPNVPFKNPLCSQIMTHRRRTRRHWSTVSSDAQPGSSTDASEPYGSEQYLVKKVSFHTVCLDRFDYVLNR